MQYEPLDLWVFTEEPLWSTCLLNPLNDAQLAYSLSMSLDVGWNLLVLYAHFSAQSCVLALMLTLVQFPEAVRHQRVCTETVMHTHNSLCPCDSCSLGLTLWRWPTWHNFSYMPCFPSGNFSTFSPHLSLLSLRPQLLPLIFAPHLLLSLLTSLLHDHAQTNAMLH